MSDDTGYSDEDYNTIENLSFVSASLSCAGCIFIIFSYLFFKNLQMFPFKLIFFVSCTELVVSILTFVVEDNACWIRAAITDYFELSTMMWISIISFNIFQILCLGNKNVQLLEKYYHLVAWGIPLLLWIPVAVTGSFGDAGIWCWIPASKITARWACYYGPWTIVILFNVSLHLYITRSIYFQSKTKKISPQRVMAGQNQTQVLSDKQESQILTRLRLYVAVFLWVSFWSFGHRMDELIHGHQSHLTTFAILHAFFRPLQGFLNSIVYGINRRLLNEYKVFFFTLHLFNSKNPHKSSQMDQPPFHRFSLGK
eukprot:c240_g1_i1.p1 GENE.c240_g1_i1~~c240_g1_i1.p1  ORF type:complete len:312 (+),score=69.81 c240_g1_i1:20-955(+)